MPPRIKIRGIHSSALTKLALDGGYPVVGASADILERFGLRLDDTAPSLAIRDKADRQGVELMGEPERVTQFFTFLQENLLDATMLGLECMEESDNRVKASIEFPGVAKSRLDELRSSVCPTLLRHHRLRIIDSRRLERLEKSLEADPDQKDKLDEQAFREMICLPLEKRGLFELEHIRPSGKPMRPRRGVIRDADGQKIVFHRSFTEGRYDGLDLPIERGDFGLTEVQEGSWVVKHSYYSMNKELKGEYYNINTPVEFYPYGARYLDLEVDVICRSGEKPTLVDQEKLAILANEGRISKELESKALQVAEELLRSLQ